MNPEHFAKIDVLQTESLKLLPKYVPLLKWRHTENETAIDIGCGTGNITWEILRPLLPPGVQLVGSDFDANMLKFIAKKYPELKTLELDIASDNLPGHLGESFDHIFSFYTLMRIRNLKQAFQNIYDMLKPGGQFFTYYPCSSTTFDILFKLSKKEKWAQHIPDLKKAFSYFELDDVNIQDVLQKMIEDVGFKISLCKVEFRNHVFPSIEEFKVFLVGVSPNYSKLSPKLKQEFVDDAVEILLEHKIWVRENHNNSNNFLLPINLMILHATK